MIYNIILKKKRKALFKLIYVINSVNPMFTRQKTIVIFCFWYHDKAQIYIFLSHLKETRKNRVINRGTYFIYLLVISILCTADWSVLSKGTA